MSLSPQWLDELRARLTLSTIVGRTTKLTKKGREYAACCPFHNEKSPSFYVNDEKGFYHCFGCGAHGDAIRWLTDQRGMGFMDAVKDLAAEAGLEVPAPDPQSAQRLAQQAGLHDVMAAAQAFFVGQLAQDEGAKARAYLATRGFDAATCQRFGFGYAPEGRQALKAALRQFPEPLLIEAGLRIVVEDKEPYDRFRGRLMLPIEDARGRVIAFGGRILDKTKTDAPKYLNSPDTPLFDKGRTLYNLHRAGPVSRQSGRLVVVEGYMDAIAMSAGGFGECVAPLGTALTERQLEMAWRLVETPVLCFDGDAAGQRAAMRAITRALPLLRPAHSLSIVRMPEGLDPDDLLKAQGPKAMEALLSNAASLLDTLWAHERDALPLTTPEAKAGLKARLMEHVNTIADEDIKALYRRELTDRFSAFAFPQRQNTPFAPRAQQPRAAQGKMVNGRWTREPPVPTSPLPETAARLRKGAGRGQREKHFAVLSAGLMRHPQEIARHAEALCLIAREDARIDVLLDHLDGGGVLEMGAIATIWAEHGLPLPSPDDWAGLTFGFLDDDHPAQPARDELAEMVMLVAEREAVELAYDTATKRFEREFSDEAFAEQERLRKRKLEFEARLRHMGHANEQDGDIIPPEPKDTQPE